MNIRLPFVAAAACVLLATFNARAGIIEYELTNITGSTWRYDYSVTNNSLPSLFEFTIWFDGSVTSGLNMLASPAGWDSIVAQPDAAIPHDGFFDSLNFESLALNETLGGFAVQFDWLGTGTPGAQLFEFVDPDSFAVLDSGSTQLRVAPPPPPTSVPEPGSLGLLLAGLGALRLARRRIAQ